VTTTARPLPEGGLHAFAVPERVRLIGIPVLIALVQVGITAIAAGHQDDVRGFDAGAIALLLVGPAALLLRRTRPALTLVLALASTMTYALLDYPEGPVYLALLTAFVNAVMRGRRAVAWASLPVGYVVTAWIAPLVHDDGPWPDWPTVAALGAWLLVLGAVTELARTRLERSAEQARARAEAARRRASEERLLIARELHDVLAHNISLINVRAGVALHLLDERPDRVDVDQVRPALAAIKDASKDALGELRSVLDVLRQNEPAPLAPTAGLGDLDALAERGRGAGLDVRVERTNGSGTGLPATDLTEGLPAGVELAAFRVAQEAMTNVVRHAGASRVTMRVRRTDDELEVRVDDDGHGAPAAGDPQVAPARGRGIAGMRERAQALGGTLDAGPRPGRGFRVLARFPLRGDE
jgi:signal transduction histidine kinase